RMSLAPDWNQGRGFLALLERFAGTERWDDPATLKAAYERHNAEVRQTVPPHRLLEWRAAEGWAPLCRALGVPVPDLPFPWINRRSDWAR
ncbi:MAG: sulfotransferase, partial [Anaerolineales bacterium]